MWPWWAQAFFGIAFGNGLVFGAAALGFNYANSLWGKELLVLVLTAAILRGGNRSANRRKADGEPRG